MKTVFGSSLLRLPTLFLVFLALSASIRVARATETVVFHPEDDKGVLVPPNSRTQGLIRVAYDETVNCIDTVVMIAVGTAMSVGDYSTLSTVTARGTSIAVVVADHRPNNPFKQAWWGWDKDPRDKLYNLAVYVQANIASHVHQVCDNVPTKFILGGHSASSLTVGEVVLQVSQEQGSSSELTIHGVVGLEPEYRRLPSNAQPWSGLDLTSIPTVMWGNSQDTCRVTVNAGGKYGYEQSSPDYRVLYQIQLEESGRNMGHCDLTDKGCAGVCALSDRNEFTKQAMATSMQKLATAVHVSNPSSYFTKDKLTLPSSSLSLKMFLNNDEVGAFE